MRPPARARRGSVGPEWETLPVGGRAGGHPGGHRCTQHLAEIPRRLVQLDTGQQGRPAKSSSERESRSSLATASPLERAKRRGWALIALDLGVDTATPTGELFAGITALVAQYERRLIGARTSAAMQAMKAAGQTFGRPDRAAQDVVERVVAERAAGRTLQAIAEGLDADGVPRAQGGAKWYPATVAVLLRRHATAAALAVAA